MATKLAAISLRLAVIGWKAIELAGRSCEARSARATGCDQLAGAVELGWWKPQAGLAEVAELGRWKP